MFDLKCMCQRRVGREREREHKRKNEGEGSERERESVCARIHAHACSDLGYLQSLWNNDLIW